MEYDIESILEKYEDDYNPGPRPVNQGPRNMYASGQLVSNTVDGSRPGYSGKKEVLSKTKFIKLITKNSDKTYNEFVEILNKDYTAAGGKPFTKGIIADRARAYDLSGTLSKKEPQGRSQESIEQRRIAENKRYYEMKKTKEGRAKQKKYRLAAKAKEYLNLGIDPPASTPEEALWRDAVNTAKKNKDGNGRFSFKSGYEKSMSRKNFFSNKIKIIDNVTGKTFNYNNYKNFITKNAKSFGINSYNDAIKPYRQKDFVNKTPGLRNSINSALIPNYNEGSKTNAFTVQHNLGRQKNPLKVSLAFYDENTKEYYARDNFEKAWEKSKTSKTPLADRKKAFNIFKTKVDELNVVSQPSMIKRNRSFGKELDLEEGLKIAKKKGAKIPYGTFKKLKTELNTDLLKLAGTKNKKCKGLLSYGGRVGLAEGLSPEFCINEGRKVAQKALFEEGATPAQKSIARRLISTGGKIALNMLNPKELIRLSNLVGPGALGLMGLYEAGSITDDVLRLNKPLDEALAGNWLTKSFLPYSEEFAKQKNLLQSGQLAGDQKEYALEMMKMENFVKEGQRIEGMAATKLLDNSGYGNIDGSPMVSKEDMNKAYAGMFGRLMRMKPYMFEEGITGRSLENEAAMNEYQDSRLAKTGKYTSAISEDKFRLPGQRQIKQDENYEFASSPIFGGPQPMVNKAPRPKNMGRGPMTEKNRMNLDLSIPGYTPYDKTYTPTDEETLQIYRNQGIVPPTTGYLAPGEGTKFRMGLASQGGNRSIYGSKFMEGGIASLNVNKK